MSLLHLLHTFADINFLISCCQLYMCCCGGQPCISVEPVWGMIQKDFTDDAAVIAHMPCPVALHNSCGRSLPSNNTCREQDVNMRGAKLLLCMHVVLFIDCGVCRRSRERKQAQLINPIWFSTNVPLIQAGIDLGCCFKVLTREQALLIKKNCYSSAFASTSPITLSTSLRRDPCPVLVMGRWSLHFQCHGHYRT